MSPNDLFILLLQNSWSYYSTDRHDLIVVQKLVLLTKTTCTEAKLRVRKLQRSVSSPLGVNFTPTEQLVAKIYLRYCSHKDFNRPRPCTQG